ncbi:MAG: hypothetical protein AAF717_05085 [Bacteroidota bacterium]
MTEAGQIEITAVLTSAALTIVFLFLIWRYRRYQSKKNSASSNNPKADTWIAGDENNSTRQD